MAIIYPIPFITTAQRANLASPTTGQQIYNTTTNTFQYYNGSAWVDGIAGQPSALIPWGAYFQETTNETLYWMPGSGGNNNNETISSLPLWACTIRSLKVNITYNTASNTDNLVFTLRYGGAGAMSDSGLVITATPGTTGVLTSTADQAITDGQVICIRSVSAGFAAAGWKWTGGMIKIT